MTVLSGCVSYHDKPIDPAASAQSVQARSLRDPQLLHFVGLDQRHSSAPIRWNLATLTMAALFERPEMRVAVGQVRLAQAEQRTAAEWPNPVLALSPSYEIMPQGPSPWIIGPSITELVQTAGKRPATMEAARERLVAMRQQLAVVAWQVRFQVRSALIDLWSARRRLKLSRAYAEAAREVTKLVSERYRQGMVSSAVLTNQQSTDTQAALAVTSAERQEQLAVAAVATAIAVPKRAIETAVIDLREWDRPAIPRDLAALRGQALTQRPEVLGALARYNAAQAALKLAIAQQYPDLNIGPGYEYDQGGHRFTLGISLPVPVLNQNQGAIAEARAARQVAAAEFEQTQTTVLGQIETAVTDWEASRQEATRTQLLLHLAADTVRRDHAAFAAGQIGRLELAGAELAQAQTELGALAAETDQRTALGRLEDAFHRPFIGPEGK